MSEARSDRLHFRGQVGGTDRGMLYPEQLVKCTDTFVYAWRGSCYVIYRANVPANVLYSTDNGKLLAASLVALVSLAAVSWWVLTSDQILLGSH